MLARCRWYTCVLSKMGNDASLHHHAHSSSDDDDMPIRILAANQHHYFHSGSVWGSYRMPRVKSAKEANFEHVPDTSGIAGSDIGHEIKYFSGKRLAQCRPSELIRHRQQASHRHLRTLRARLSCAAVPNSSRILCEFPTRVFIGRFSEKGDKYVTCCQSGAITLFDVEGRRIVPFRSLKGRDIGWSIVDLAFSPDERFAVYSSWCSHLYMVSATKDSQEVHTPLDMRPEPEQHFCAFSLQFSKDNHQLLAGCNRGNIFIYDRLRGDRTLGFQAHRSDVNATSFGDDSSNLLFSGSDDLIVKAWDRRTLSETSPKSVVKFTGHDQGLTCVSARGDGRYLISNAKDHTIKLWDIRSPSRGTGSGGDQDSHSAAAASNNEQDVSVMTYRGHLVRNTLVQCRFSPLHTTGQRFIYTGSAFGACVIYDVLTGRVVEELGGHESVVRDVSWHPFHDNLLTTASWDGTVMIWERNIPFGEKIQPYRIQPPRSSWDEDGDESDY